MAALLFIPWFKLEGWTIPGTSVGIQPFGILVAMGVILGAQLSEKRAAKLGMRRDVINDFITHSVGIGFIGAHVFDMIWYYPEKVVERPWELLMIWKSLSSFGGFFGAVFGAFVWKWRRGFPVFPALDQVAFGLPLGWFFGRMGCFVVHDHPGRITDFFLAVDNYQYPGLPVGPRHDLGLYEVLWSIVVVPLFLWLDRKPRPHGFYIGLIAILYAPVRFGLDFLREADATYYGLTPGHYSAIATLFLGIWVMWMAYKRQPVKQLPRGMLADTETPTGTPAAQNG